MKNGNGDEEIPDPEELLRTGKACQLLGISYITINRWIHSGRLPAIRTLGGEYRIRRGDIETVLLHGQLTAKQRRRKKLL